MEDLAFPFEMVRTIRKFSGGVSIPPMKKETENGLRPHAVRVCFSESLCYSPLINSWETSLVSLTTQVFICFFLVDLFCQKIGLWEKTNPQVKKQLVYCHISALICFLAVLPTLQILGPKFSGFTWAVRVKHHILSSVLVINKQSQRIKMGLCKCCGFVWWNWIKVSKLYCHTLFFLDVLMEKMKNIPDMYSIHKVVVHQASLHFLAKCPNLLTEILWGYHLPPAPIITKFTKSRGLFSNDTTSSHLPRVCTWRLATRGS